MTLMLITIALSALSGEGKTLFEQANAAYYQGDYDQAIATYGTMIEQHGIKSPALFFNLANAWRKKGNTGKAVLYYEAALSLDLRFEPARKNLESALKNTRRNLPPPDARQLDQQSLLHYYPFTAAQSLFLTHAALVMAMALLVLRYWRESPRTIWLGRVLPALAVLFFVFTLATNYRAGTSPKLAVTLNPEAPVYFSMSELDSPRFVLYEGDRVLIDRFEGDWVRVHAYGGERGWTRRDNTGVVDYSGI